jgi:hypothetical protein
MSQIEMAKKGKMSQIKRTLEAIFIKSISDVPQTEAPAAIIRETRGLCGVRIFVRDFQTRNYLCYSGFENSGFPFPLFY